MSAATVLVVGGGGREHALAWALGRSPRVGEVLVAPGNAGTGAPAGMPDPADVEAFAEAAHERAVDLVVIGPEAPLVAGLADACRARGLAVYGPDAAAARLEASKVDAKAFMLRHGVPTAAARRCDDASSALAALTELGAPIVVKRSGLAGGKGVTVAESVGTAEVAVREAFAAGEDAVLLEERLVGQEVSLLVVCDGRDAVPLRLAQDYKQAEDGDQGPMTGGMGCVAPVDLLDDAALEDVMRRVVRPTLDGLRAEGTPFVGTLFVGLMLTERGPLVLEYNVRFGDPETQVLLPLLESDPFELLRDAARGALGARALRWRDGACACVVMAAPGYPGSTRTGTPLAVPDDLGPDVLVFHAGTRLVDGRLVSAGGRVLNVVALGTDRNEAIARAYAAVDRIGFVDAHYRRDIGSRLADA